MVKTEIAALRAIQPTVRKTSAFGDNHHDAIDAQIHVLEASLTDDQIYDRYAPPGNSEEGQNVFSAALDARRWLDGEPLDDATGLADSWSSLVIK